MDNDYKYTVIISQYYHDRHYVVVEFNKETFIKQMQNCTKELDLYKSNNLGNLEDLKHSDPFYSANFEIRSRYNVNAHGDIYFLNTFFANRCQEEIQRDIRESKYSRQGFKKKQVLDDISKNHSYRKVFEIIEKHFKIA
ncbi:MAG: hypothetical protein ACREV6_19625 [Clostridium sp.]|uniref:hypothetical protein n=1 Tax=Clostridium sp. TaxID=1506 RepID=UPI003D6D6EED